MVSTTMKELRDHAVTPEQKVPWVFPAATEQRETGVQLDLQDDLETQEATDEMVARGKRENMVRLSTWSPAQREIAEILDQLDDEDSAAVTAETDLVDHLESQDHQDPPVTMDVAEKRETWVSNKPEERETRVPKEMKDPKAVTELIRNPKSLKDVRDHKDQKVSQVLTEKKDHVAPTALTA